MKEITKKAILLDAVLGTIKISAFTAFLWYLGSTAYNEGFKYSNETLAEKHATEDYNDIKKKISGIEVDKNLTDRIYSVTGIFVGEEEYFKEVNLKLESITSKEDLEVFATKYIKKYIDITNEYIEEDKLTVAPDGKIYYHGNVLELDHDAMYVLENMINTLKNGENITSLTDELQYIDDLKRQLLISQVYEQDDDATSKKLALKLREEEFLLNVQ